MGDMIGTVATLSRFPVKSMQGQRLARIDVAHRGLVGDRAYALVETDTGKVMSAKNPRVGVQLFACRSEFVQDPKLGDDPPPVRITMPDGTSVTSDAAVSTPRSPAISDATSRCSGPPPPGCRRRSRPARSSTRSRCRC